MVQKETLEKRGNLNDSLYFLYMRSLQESLFDKDLVERDIKIGSEYKPIRIACIREGGSSFKAGIGDVSNLFIESKLKSAAPYDISLNTIEDLLGVQKHISNYAEFLRYVIPIVLDLPLKPEFISQTVCCQSWIYDKELKDSFEKTTTKRSYGKTLTMELRKIDNIIDLLIRRRYPSGVCTVAVEFIKK